MRARAGSSFQGARGWGNLPHHEALTRTVEPKALPLEWGATIKPGLLLSDDLQKDWVESLLVPTAADWVEGKTGRALITQTWELRMPQFPVGGGRITIPKPPLITVDSIQYIDTGGILQTWSNTLWQTENPAKKGPKVLQGHVWPAFNQHYPTAQHHPESVTITFTCGYGPAAKDVPAGLREAMFLIVSDRFLNREATISGTVIREVPMGAQHIALTYLAEAA